MIKQFPLSFAIVCALSLGMAYLLMRWFYADRLSARDDLLALYREKLNIRPADKTRYTAMRNRELKIEAGKVAERLRVGAAPYRTMEAKRTGTLLTQVRGAKTEEERLLLSEKSNQEMIAQVFEFISMYQKVYKADVILLRDEMIARLPQERRTNFESLGELAAKPDMLDEIAVGLDQMAKLLPEA